MTIRFNLFKECFPNIPLMFYVLEIKRSLRNCKTLLDVGCGPSSPIRFLDKGKKVGVDIHSPSIKEAKVKGTHDEFYQLDLREIGKQFGQKEFDCCVALDVIEHFSKKDGYRLIAEMEKIALKKVLIFTPNGFLPQQGESTDFQEHLSGWSADEMRELGYTVRGIFGHKWFRGERHRLRLRPRILWGIISLMTDYLYTRITPESATALLCIKIIR